MAARKQQRPQGPRLYTTTRKASRSVSEIMSLLTEFGAESFHVQQKDGKVAAVAFVARGIVFQITPHVEGLRRRLEKLPRPDKAASPEDVAWAQLRDWTELQLEMIESGIVSPTQAFGGFALTSAGRPVAEMLEERHAELLPGETRLLPSRTSTTEQETPHDR